MLTVAELEDLERHNILLALEAAGWRSPGDDGAAKLLAMNPSTLPSHMRALGIRRPRRGSRVRSGSRASVSRILASAGRTRELRCAEVDRLGAGRRGACNQRGAPRRLRGVATINAGAWGCSCRGSVRRAVNELLRALFPRSDPIQRFLRANQERVALNRRRGVEGAAARSR